MTAGATPSWCLALGEEAHPDRLASRCLLHRVDVTRGAGDDNQGTSSSAQPGPRSSVSLAHRWCGQGLARVATSCHAELRTSPVAALRLPEPAGRPFIIWRACASGSWVIAFRADPRFRFGTEARPSTHILNFAAGPCGQACAPRRMGRVPRFGPCPERARPGRETAASGFAVRDEGVRRDWGRWSAFLMPEL